jgi:prephenate dehydrogenase
MSGEFKRITIIGAGLIGGSLAQAIKESGSAAEVRGYFRKESSLRKAKKLNILDGCYRDLKRALLGADLVILATPVQSIIEIGSKIKELLAQDAVITDAGSTKAEIVAKLGRLYPKNFIGAHPLAGSEKKGLEHADPKLFKDKVTILTPTDKSSKDTLKRLRSFWKGLGAKVVVLDPKSHDKLLSKISHLPHILMYPLLDIIAEEELRLASSGFRDATRIAASDSKIWSDIILSNRKNILKDIDSYIKKLQSYGRVIERGLEKELQSLIAEAARKRRELNE